MTQAPRLLFLVILWLGSLVLLWGVEASANSNLRMLIDVSGSMRQNDPENLRVPALRLVSELLPAGNQAGVWLFADAPEVLIPAGEVDDAWKTLARQRLRRIHSNGNFTDIESAIKTAIKDWSGMGITDEERHLVLLTDGLVDVPEAANGADTDAASRQRILDTTIARLQDLGVKAHVVALSDQVDADLVEALTQQTGGWLEVAETADALQRAFLRMLEQSAPPTTVPIEGNRFTIDDGVREFTLLAFRAPGEPVSLIDPAGKTITVGRIPLNTQTKISWNDALDYDLVTVTAPEAGEWQLQGSLDPDNRVAVMTDLGVAMKRLPNAIPYQASLWLELWPTEQGAPITMEDFLRLSAAKAVFTTSPTRVTRDEILDSLEQSAGAGPGAAAGPEPDPDFAIPGADEAGAPALSLFLPLDPESLTYRIEVPPATLEPGTYRIRATLEAATFTRQINRNLRVTEAPLELIYQPQQPAAGESAAASLEVRLEFESELIRPETLFGYLRLEGPDGADSLLEFNAPDTAATTYRIPIERPGRYRARARLRAETAAGEPLVLELPEEHFTFDFADDPAAQTPAERREGISWGLLSAVVGMGTLAFGLLIALVLWLTRAPSAQQRKKSRDSEQDTASTGEVES